MALDDSKHFTLLTSRISAISPTTPPGNPQHPHPSARLAIIHLVREARGLDVNPGTIDRFRRTGDLESVKAMEVIHAARHRGASVIHLGVCKGGC
ncbi:hypothetical protein K443DRAFT_9079 [Laccaria amethystina LaAM-08-1]|uniref:Uncharacterized protein n=1 Tax=Laccaria amethystina LaAM-08-1 TaxID=1095629 RepID=A0A0C9WMX0_9AGAR|nr:hypothetical protein K443DRAFT_9079 [Laccaria amethystina LaAM-08-1]